MRLIDDHQEIIRKIVQKRTGRLPGSRSCQMAGIVLDSRAEPSFPHHFHVKIRPFRNPLRLQKLILALKKATCSFISARISRRQSSSFPSAPHNGRPEKSPHAPAALSPRRSAHQSARSDLPHRRKTQSGKPRFQNTREIPLKHLPAPETSPLKIHLVSCILNIDQLMDHFIPVLLHPRPKRNYHIFYNRWGCPVRKCRIPTPQ